MTQVVTQGFFKKDQDVKMKKNFLKTAKEKKENEIKQKLEEKLEEKTIKFLKPKAKNIYLAIKNNKLFLKENVNAKKTIEKESENKYFF